MVRFYCFFILALAVLFSPGCKKERIEKNYTGSFLFTVQSHMTHFNGPPTDASFTYNGKIIVSDEVPNGMPKNETYLKIYYSPQTNYLITEVDTHGNFLSTGFTGGFDNKNELNFTYSITGLSASTTETVHGTRR